MASIFENSIKKLEEEMRPNLADIPKSEPKVEPEVKDEPKAVPVEEPLSSEERSELAADEREVFDDKPVGEYQNRENPNVGNWEEQVSRPKREGNVINNRVQDIENEYNKAKVILQGATNSNARFGGLVPWSLVLGKIETAEDKQNFRNGKAVLLSACVIAGKDSDLAAYVWEDLSGENSISRASQGFAAKLLQTQISQTFTDKNVKTSRNSGEKGSYLNSLQPPQTAYQ